MARPSETGSHPTGQAPSGLDASRFDPAREGVVLMAELGSLWMDFVGSDHHKDRDCHFVIEQYFSYGEPPYWTAHHCGYVDDGFGVCTDPPERREMRFHTYETALSYCVEQTLAMFRRHHRSLSAETITRLKELTAPARLVITGDDA